MSGESPNLYTSRMIIARYASARALALGFGTGVQRAFCRKTDVLAMDFCSSGETCDRKRDSKIEPKLVLLS